MDSGTIIQDLDCFDEPLLIPDDMLELRVTDELFDANATTPTLEQVNAMERATMELIRSAMTSLKPDRRGRDKSTATEKISIRIPVPILDLIKAKAARAGVRYQTYINQMIAESATSA